MRRNLISTMNPNRRAFLMGRRAAPLAIRRRPPWACQPEAAFTARCTGCGDCVRACPRGVLRIAEDAYPEISFEEAGCSLCGECERVCTTGALSLSHQAAPFPWRAKVANSCLATQGITCRLCGDTCEVRAILFRPALGGRTQVSIDLNTCTGCGECLPVCPVGAIGIDSIEVTVAT